MFRKSFNSKLTVAIAAAMIPGIVMAQDSSQTDLTGQDVTVEKLVGALNIPIRGIEARCSPYQEEMTRRTRGIGVEPAKAEDVPALSPVKTASVSATFELNSAQLSPETMSLLTTVAEALNGQDLASQCFQLAGHTCDLGDDAYNMDLSRRRADAVRAYLVSLGVNEERLVTTGFGETSPIVPNSSEAMREKNRRVDLGALAPAALEYSN